MGVFEKIFGKREQPAVLKASSTFQLLEGYTPAFHSWNGSIFESDLIRAALDAHGKHAAKLKVNIRGSAKENLQNRLKIQPNPFQTWSQFLYREAVILYARNTAFIVPVKGEYGETNGVIGIVPESWELVEYQGTPYIRFRLKNNKKAAVNLYECGILTRYQYENELFGASNAAMKPVLDLIEMQRQGITEGIKNGASFRFSAQSDNWATDEDLAAEMERFNKFTVGNKKAGGGTILFPNTYKNIQQLKADGYKIDADQMKLIKENVFDYFAVNEDIIQNKSFGDQWLAFYEGAVEWFAIQLSEDTLVEAYDTGKGPAPSVELHFDASDANSGAAREILSSFLNNYETALVNKFDIAEINTATEEQSSGQLFASILPMLLMTMLYSGCTSVATESIAGEKERGTIATLLITPVKRSHIALGKILALSLIALLSGVSSILGTVLSLPKMMGDAVSGSIYGMREYLLLSVVILSTVLLMVTAISIISTFAKSVKEAGTMTSPLMVVVMLFGVIGMAGLGSGDNYALYLIPLYNTSQAMASIFSFGDVGIPVLLTALSNFICALAGIWVLTKLFRSERILYKV